DTKEGRPSRTLRLKKKQKLKREGREGRRTSLEMTTRQNQKQVLRLGCHFASEAATPLRMTKFQGFRVSKIAGIRETGRPGHRVSRQIPPSLSGNPACRRCRGDGLRRRIRTFFLSSAMRADRR